MAVNLSPVGGVAAQFFTNTGAVLTGGKLYTYLAGTTTPTPTYTTSAGNVARTNPIVLDAAGRVSGSGEIWLTAGIIYKFVLTDSADVLIGTYDNVSSQTTTDASLVTYTPAGAGAVTTTVQVKLRQSVSVMDFGAVGDGVTNDTAAFTSARAVTNRYYIPTGSYVLDGAFDPFIDCYTSSSGVTLIVGGVSYNCSNAYAGALRYNTASFQKTDTIHSKTGNTIMYMQDGSPGTATGFYRGLAFTTDSHFIQCQPSTNGGQTDLLFQRSTLNADPGGNRFSFDFNEANDELSYAYATTASGLPNFDVYMTVKAGVAPKLNFVRLPANFNSGWISQNGGNGALKLNFNPTTATTATFYDETSGNVLEKINRSRVDISGVAFDTLLDTPSGVTQPRMWGGVYSDSSVDANGTLPVTKNLWSTTNAGNGNQVIGTLMVASATSNGTLGYRESRFVFDGTTVTLTDLVNTLPAQVTATVAVSGTNLQFQASYAGGLGGGCTVTAMCNWCGAGR
jgi:hypothetical protein